MAAKPKQSYAPRKAETKAQKAKATAHARQVKAGKIQAAEARSIAGYTRRAALQSKAVNHLAARSFGKHHLSAVQSRSVVNAHIRMAVQQAATRAAESAQIDRYAARVKAALAGKVTHTGKLSSEPPAKRRAKLAHDKLTHAKPAAKTSSKTSKPAAKTSHA